MNLIRLFLLTIFLFAFAVSPHAQNVKPRFKKFEYVTYHPVGSNSSLHIEVEYNLEINENGIAHYKTIYENGVADTSFKIPDSLIIEMNKIFNGVKKLKSYMAVNKFPDGQFFAGPLEFISYNTFNGVTDNFIIVMPFMKQEFIDLMDKVSYLRFPRIAIPGKAIITKDLNDTIIKYHKACQYIPQIDQPPTYKIV